MKQINTISKIIFFLFFIITFSLQSQDILIENGSEWNYYDKGYLDEDWMFVNNFSNWKTGTTPIGYGDPKVKTKIGYGGNPEKKHITKYFKKKIHIDLDKYFAYEFKVQRDDGIIVYINGKEVFRENMPDVKINGKTFAVDVIDGKEEDIFTSYIFDKSIFSKNEATISVSIHQAYESSSDCIFDMELIGHTNPEILSLVVVNKNKANKELYQKIEELNSKFEYDKLVLKMESQQNYIYSLKIVIFLLAILLIIGFTVSYFMLNASKSKNKEIQKLNDSLINDILNKEKEMVTSTTNLLHNKQYFKEIKADLKGIKTEDKSEIKSIIKQIDYILDRDDDWETLKKHFNAVNDGFYDKIIKKHPNLSETELRHCIFIKLHMHTKEIAKILLIDPRSVQTARYRIKKKMNLSEDEDLRDYLLNFE